MAKPRKNMTVLELIEETTQKTDSVIVTSLLFNGSKLNTSRGNVWTDSCTLFLTGKATTSKELEDYIVANMEVSELEKAPMQKERITFRSWEKTMNLWKYFTYIVKAVENNDISTVFPQDEKLPTISEIKKLAYPEMASDKTEMEKFGIMLGSLSAVFGKLSEEEKETALKMVGEIF